MYDTQGCIYVWQGHRVQFQIRYSFRKQTGSVQWLQASAVKGLNSNPGSSCFGCISLDGSLYGAISLWEYLKSVHGKCVFWKKKKKLCLGLNFFSAETDSLHHFHFSRNFVKCPCTSKGVPSFTLQVWGVLTSLGHWWPYIPRSVPMGRYLETMLLNNSKTTLVFNLMAWSGPSKWVQWIFPYFCNLVLQN